MATPFARKSATVVISCTARFAALAREVGGLVVIPQMVIEDAALGQIHQPMSKIFFLNQRLIRFLGHPRNLANCACQIRSQDGHRDTDSPRHDVPTPAANRSSGWLCVRTDPKAIKRNRYYGLALGSSLRHRRSVDKQFHKLHDAQSDAKREREQGGQGSVISTSTHAAGQYAHQWE